VLALEPVVQRLEAQLVLLLELVLQLRLQL
jgi:hypothetical protein